MTVGCLGDIEFKVSDETVETVSNMKWSGSARYTAHKRIGNALTEFSGLDPDKITLDIQLALNMGVDPMKELTKLWRYMREGRTLPFVLGDHAYGRYRWTITQLSTKVQHTDGRGNIIFAVVSVTLQEYLRY